MKFKELLLDYIKRFDNTSYNEYSKLETKEEKLFFIHRRYDIRMLIYVNSLNIETLKQEIDIKMVFSKKGIVKDYHEYSIGESTYFGLLNNVADKDGVSFEYYYNGDCIKVPFDMEKIIDIL